MPLLKTFIRWLKSFLPTGNGQYIHSIPFTNSHGTEFIFTLGDEFVINENTKGKVEKITVNNSTVIVRCESFTVKHTMHGQASFVLKPYDANKAVRDELMKVVLEAKKRALVNPILANEVIKELAMEKK